MTPEIEYQIEEDLSLQAAAAQNPNAPALIGEGHVFTFADLLARAETVGREVFSRSELPERPIVTLGSVTLETLDLIYAALERKKPLLLLHPNQTPKELGRLCARLGVVRIEGESQIPQPSAAPDVKAPMPADLVPAINTQFIVQTSGSSGFGRGVQLSRAAFWHSARLSAKNLGWVESDAWLLNMPLSHVAGLSIVMRALIARRPVVYRARFEPKAWLEDVENYRVTIASLVHRMLHRLLDYAPGKRAPASLRAVLVGGDRAPSDLMARAHGLGWPCLRTYGLSETCSQVATQMPTKGSGKTPSGIRVLDGISVKVAQDNEILVKSPTLFSGYYPGANKASLDDEGYFRTGDLGHLGDNGALEIFGRKSNTIITGGENVSPEEIEAHFEKVSGVSSVVALGIEDAQWGQRLVLVVECAARLMACTKDEIATLARELAPFRRPKEVYVTSSLPRTPSGKIRRTAVDVSGLERLEDLGGETASMPL